MLFALFGNLPRGPKVLVTRKDWLHSGWWDGIAVVQRKRNTDVYMEMYLVVKASKPAESIVLRQIECVEHKSVVKFRLVSIALSW